jgi:CheY-like chemotaxis protein
MTQVFLSYAGPDAERVKAIYEKLAATEFTPWMAAVDIRVGEAWEYAIEQAINRSDFFIACLTNNSLKRGYLQQEIRRALEIWRRMLQSDIFLLPVRLEQCTVPESLASFQRADLFLPGGWERLIASLEEGMRRRNETRQQPREPDSTSITDPNRKVLIVEDDNRLIVFLADQINAMGFTTLIARNGAEGLETAYAEKPSLIILDIMMPKMDGYEVCRRVKSNPETKHIPVLLLSARGPLQDNDAALASGADDYMAKPYEMDVLEARVRGLLDRS